MVSTHVLRRFLTYQLEAKLTPLPIDSLRWPTSWPRFGAGSCSRGGTTRSGEDHASLRELCSANQLSTQVGLSETQPRRIAVRAAADRIASELGGEVGGLVGYQVRFDHRVMCVTALSP